MKVLIVQVVRGMKAFTLVRAIDPSVRGLWAMLILQVVRGMKAFTLVRGTDLLHVQRVSALALRLYSLLEIAQERAAIDVASPVPIVPGFLGVAARRLLCLVSASTLASPTSTSLAMMRLLPAAFAS